MTDCIHPDYSARKAGKPTMPITERLLSKVVLNKSSGCWEWQGYTRNGYGRTTIGSRKDGTRHTISVHRLAYITWVGEIPQGFEVCHKCDNPCCINPEHLFVGTRQDNIDDRERKGRNIVFIGEEQGKAKLTKKIVKDARWERAYKRTSFQKLADKYGVNKKTMINAIKGITWKCVSYFPSQPEPPKEETDG